MSKIKIGKKIYEAGKDKIEDIIDIFEDLDLPLTTGKKYQENLGKNLDDQTLNVLTNQNLKAAELDQAAKNITKKDNIVKDFTAEQVPSSYLRINPETGGVEINVLKQKTGSGFYPIEQVDMRIDSTGGKYFTLKDEFKFASKINVPTPGEYKNFGVKFASDENVKNVINKYLSGDITKTEAGRLLDNIDENFTMNFSQPNKPELYKPKERFEPFLEGYVSTLEEVPESYKFLQYYKKNKPNPKTRDLTLSKVNEAVNVMKKLENDSFNKIKLPDGTTMKDQPIGVRLYNAWRTQPGFGIQKGDSKTFRGGTISESVKDVEYSKFVKKYIVPYYKFKNPNVEEIPDFSKGKGRNLSMLPDTKMVYMIKKGERKYVIPDEYKPFFNQVKEVMYENIPSNLNKDDIYNTFSSHLARMIGYAKEQGANPNDIIRVIQNIDAQGFTELISRKRALENQVRLLRDQAMGGSLKTTNPELYPEIINKNRKLGDFDVGLIELSHIEDVVDNWKAAFDLNNIFLAPGKFNREQLIFDTKMKSLLNKFSKAESFSQKKSILQDIKRIEQQLIDKNLISKFGDRYFGVNKDSAIEANLLKKVEEAVDFTRYLKDGGLVSIEEVLEYANV